MTTLAWKLNRLKLMGAPELVWRVQQLLQKKASKFGVGLVRRVPAPQLERMGRPFLAGDGGDTDVAALRAAADAVLAGRWNVFALQGADLGFPPQWNRDPKTGTVAPLTLGKQIDYRSEKVVGDIKYLWEPNRHLELVALAQAWKVTGERRYADGARLLLESWFAQCPYPMGVNWTSSLELALRLLNWACAWELLGGLASPLFQGEAGLRFQRQWLDAIYQHSHFIAGYFSRHSSANNHLFGEYMGLFVASVVWPCWPDSRKWQALARKGLEEEALKQNTPDGVNREQAVYYQHEVMDMMLLCQLVGRANGAGFSAAYLERLERLADFIASLMDVAGNVPMTGDADDAQMVRLAHDAGWHRYRSLLASCAVLSGRADFKRKAGHFDDKNRWLFGVAGMQQWQALDAGASETPVLAFPEGGYFLLGSDFGTPDEVRMVIDCAPLGYLSIAAHGHADALAFTLSAAGEELLVDPGTYAYHTQKKWRDHFRATAAHNTVGVDGLDQSEIGGNFMWLKKANARMIAHETGSDKQVQVFEGEHDGYTRLADPVLHRRRITYDFNKKRIVVKDILQCTNVHDIAVHWQFGEGCQAAIVEGQLHVRGQRRGLHMACTHGTPELLRGNDTPPGGWIARRFDEKTPIDSVAWRVRVHGTTEIVTHIDLMPLASPAASPAAAPAASPV